MADIDKLADDLIGDANDLIATVLRKHAKGVIAGTRELYDELKQTQKDLANARHVVETIVTNLAHGASPHDVLIWMEDYGNEKVWPTRT